MMVVVLVVLTVAAFFAIDWYVRRRRPDTATPMPRQAAFAIGAAEPAQLLFHPGHTWVRVSPRGSADVGASRFAACFAGHLSHIELPEVGELLTQGQPAWTFVSDRSRRLTQVMPVDGEVVEVNRALARQPRLAQEGTDQPWILRVRPRGLPDRLHNLLSAGLSTAWDDAVRSRLNHVLSPALGARANDGGEWVPGFGELLSNEDWTKLKRELFPPIGPS